LASFLAAAGAGAAAGAEAAATAAAGAAGASDFLVTRLAAEAEAAEVEAEEVFLLIVLIPVEVFEGFKRTMSHYIAVECFNFYIIRGLPECRVPKFVFFY
jgi:hypothetical protein